MVVVVVGGVDAAISFTDTYMHHPAWYTTPCFIHNQWLFTDTKHVKLCAVPVKDEECVPLLQFFHVFPREAELMLHMVQDGTLPERLVHTGQ